MTSPDGPNASPATATESDLTAILRSLKKGWPWIVAAALLSMGTLFAGLRSALPEFQAYMTLKADFAKTEELRRHRLFPTLPVVLGEVTHHELGEAIGLTEREKIRAIPDSKAENRIVVVVLSGSAGRGRELADSVGATVSQTVFEDMVSGVKQASTDWKLRLEELEERWKVLSEESGPAPDVKQVVRQRRIAESMVDLEDRILFAERYLQAPFPPWRQVASATSPEEAASRRLGLLYLLVLAPPFVTCFLWLLWDLRSGKP